MAYADDIDRVREYVRADGQADYLRMREVAPRLVQVEFLDNIEEHSAAIAARIAEPGHVRVVQGDTPHDRATRAERYWEPRREQIVALIDDDEVITSLSFGNDDSGPLLFVGVFPYTDDVLERVTPKFAPYRIHVEEQPPVTPV